MDRRKKLSDEDREAIMRIEGMSVKDIAEQYGVSRALVYLIRDPEKARINKEKSIAYRKEHPIDPEINRARVRATRQYQKQEVNNV